MNLLFTLVLSIILWPAIASAKCEDGFHGEEIAGLDVNYTWYFNTSNPIKRGHLEELLIENNIDFLDNDLDEISADHIDVVVQKASQFNSPDRRIIVEDTALFIEGADIGPNIRWEVSRLGEMIGRKATWVSLVAYRDGDQVKVFRAAVKGVIGEKQSDKQGIEAYFRIPGAHGSLRPVKHPPSVTATFKLLRNIVHTIRPAMDNWQGDWQHHKAG